MNEANLIGRQPILNRLEEIVAYEMLFRSHCSPSRAVVHDPRQASSSVIVNALSNFGIRDILGAHRGFINVEADMLMSDSMELLPKEAIGLEILENTVFTPELVEKCRRLKEQGCLLALDDHEYSPEHEVLYDGLIDIVKFDLIQTPLERLYEMTDKLKRFPVKLLAEKVETRAVFLRCRNMGFELFQGYFFARPSLMRKKRLEESAGVMFELLRQLSEESDMSRIEQTFKKSPALTYKLLLLVNSVAVGLREKIRTVRHAISIIGMNQLKRWVQLAIFAEDDSRGLDSPVMDMAAVRAAFMEGLAGRHPQLKLSRHAPDQAFMVGILSLLKDVYDISMEEIVTGLNLTDEIKTALLHREGSLGVLLDLVEMVERLELDEASALLQEIGIPLMAALDCQNKAYSWRKGME
jgi:EAL and modified HD-GYP domain-containing signal transduction protein